MTADAPVLSLRLRRLAFMGWLAVLGLGVHFGRGLAPWLEGENAWLTGAALVILGAAGLGWALARARGGEPAAVGQVLVAAAGLALLGWIQPLMIERLHLFLYGVLGLLAWGLFPGRRGWERLWRAALLCVAVGGLDELAQALHPQRVGDWRDVATNAASSALTTWAAAVRHGGRPRFP